MRRVTTTRRITHRDDTVEARAGVAEALLASAESTEVGGGLGDDVVEELEGDAARRLVATRVSTITNGENRRPRKVRSGRFRSGSTVF